jgi:hypothetical protein
MHFRILLQQLIRSSFGPILTSYLSLTSKSATEVGSWQDSSIGTGLALAGLANGRRGSMLSACGFRALREQRSHRVTQAAGPQQLPTCAFISSIAQPTSSLKPKFPLFPNVDLRARASQLIVVIPASTDLHPEPDANHTQPRNHEHRRRGRPRPRPAAASSGRRLGHLHAHSRIPTRRMFLSPSHGPSHDPSHPTLSHPILSTSPPLQPTQPNPSNPKYITKPNHH